MNDSRNGLKLLRVLLVFAALAWGIAWGGVFLPWSVVSALLNEFGLEKVPDAPMFIYWFKMTAGAFGFIGVLFAYLAIDPRKYKPLVFGGGCFMIIEGAILLTYGLWLKLEPVPFYFDTAFCLVDGVLILYFNAMQNRGGKR